MLNLLTKQHKLLRVRKKTVKKTVVTLLMLISLTGSFATMFVPQSHAQVLGVSGAETQQSEFNERNQKPGPREDSLPVCWLSIIDGISMSGCLAQFTFYVLYSPTAWLLSAAGEIFDTTLAISMDKKYIDTPFANGGWGVVRDLVNIAFIFILLYISIATILQLATFNIRTVLIRLIIVALLVNFSLFLTKVVIDVGNILAIAFYNNITVGTSPAGNGDGYAISGIQQKNISQKIIGGFKPQALLGNASYEAWAKSGQDRGNIALAIIFLAGSAINVVAAYTFFIAGMLFIMRIVSLWFLMLGAPVAFLAWILPDTRSYAAKWWKFLVNQSFIAPVFLFFIFLITLFITNVAFMDSSFKPIDQFNDAVIDEIIVSTIIKAVLVISVLMYAVKITKSMSSDFAQGVVNKAQGAAKFAGALAAGGVMGGARLVGGRAALTARSAAAKQAESALNTRKQRGRIMGAVTGTLRTVAPGALGAIGAAGRKDVSERQKTLTEKSDAAVRAIATGGSRLTVPGVQRQAAVLELAKRKKLTGDKTGPLTSKFIQKQSTALGAIGDAGAVKAIKGQDWQNVTGTARAGAIIGIKPEDIQQLRPDFFNDEASLKVMRKNFSKKHITSMVTADNQDREELDKLKEEISVAQKSGDIKNKEKLDEKITAYSRSGKGKRIEKFLTAANRAATIKGITISDEFIANNNEEAQRWLKSLMGQKHLQAAGLPQIDNAVEGGDIQAQLVDKQTELQELIDERANLSEENNTERIKEVDEAIGIIENDISSLGDAKEGQAQGGSTPPPTGGGKGAGAHSLSTPQQNERDTQVIQQLEQSLIGLRGSLTQATNNNNTGQITDLTTQINQIEGEVRQLEDAIDQRTAESAGQTE